MTETIAAVDVGTNSLHLVVARTTAGDRFEVLTREKEMVRLGGSTSRTGDLAALGDAAVDRAVVALERFRLIAESHGAPMRAVATSAVREAGNRQVLLDRAAEEAGVEIEVVSGVEEARLIHLGVLQALDVYDRRLFLVDIGGGSTEMLLGHGGDVLASTSVKLGAVRLTNRFFADETLHPSAVESCRLHVAEMLSSFDRAVHDHPFEVAVGCSGTIEQVLRLGRALAGEGRLRSVNGAVLTRDRALAVVAALVEARRNRATADLPEMDAKRADIILAGALVLEGVLERFALEEVVFSDYALREGVFLDTIARSRAGGLPHLRDVARRSVEDLMRSLDEDPDHSRHVARLALELFESTRPLHGYGPHAAVLLEAAALLSNVGLTISHTRHHKHSYYVIRNTDRLVGLTDHEIEMVALIARYHRKSPPKNSHPEWSALAADDQALVRLASGILRVAIGLDRSHSGQVSGVGARVRDGRLVLEADPRAPEVDLGLDLYAAAERVGLLADALGLPVDVIAAPA